MSQVSVRRINHSAFVLCLASLACGIVIGLMGVWGAIATTPADGVFWRAVTSCAILFVGSILASGAVRCFRTNEQG